MTIRYEPEQLIEISNGLKAKSQDFRGLVEEMQRLIERIPDAWAGQAADMYIAKFEEFKPGFNAVEELIEIIGIQIEQVLAGAQEWDSTAAGKL